MTTSSPKTFSERVDELTGADEIAILDHFDHDVWDTYDHATDPDLPVSRKISARLSKMLVFAEKLHDGVPPKVAFANVMAMTVTEVNEHLHLAELYAEGVDGTGDPDSNAEAAAESASGKDAVADD